MYWNFVAIDGVIKNQINIQQDATLIGKNGRNSFNDYLNLQTPFQKRSSTIVQIDWQVWIWTYPLIPQNNWATAYVVGVHVTSEIKLNSMVWVRERTIPTERSPLVGEVIANFCG
jgi:hypothetical protein